MLINLLIKKFINNYNDVEDIKVRSEYGNLVSLIGIISNFILFLLKCIIGTMVGSVAILADSFNNLLDSASSIVTIIGFKMSNKMPDSEHPFGYGRVEYISALVVSFFVISLGIEFTKTSFERILNPSIISFEIVSFILLLISILIKLWLAKVNKNIGNIIDSTALKATASDALGDVFITSTVASSYLITNFINVPIDGYIGLLVAVFIIISGIKLVKETISPLLGEAPDPKLVKNISEMIMSYEFILGYHDLIIHDYGPGRIMASIHAEVPSTVDIIKIHEIIDKAEREISEKFNIHIVVHMDPILEETDEAIKSKEIINSILSKYPVIDSIHDFRVIPSDNEKKNIIFDVVVKTKLLDEKYTIKNIPTLIKDDVESVEPNFNCIITVDLG